LSPLVGLILVVFAIVLSWRITYLIRSYAGPAGLVQDPNERSSHSVPTARGGGLAVAVAGLLGLVLAGLLANQDIWAIAVLCGLIALLGLVDDLRDLSPFLRFPIQIVLIAMLVMVSGPLPPIELPGMHLAGAPLICLLVLVGLWWVNLYNFMDGIDGIAASQAILVLMLAALLWWSNDGAAVSNPLLWMMAILASATAGFLVLNWPPASIFMGDAGSNFIAMAILGIALATVSSGHLSYADWMTLTCVFVSDATVTLVRRIARGERPWRAHRRHAFQQAARRWGHGKVTVAYGGVTVLWAGPFAFAAQAWPDLQWIIVTLCYVPLAIIVVKLGGGSADEQAEPGSPGSP
jgi:Fuc2NAc and GlcNAc transferase